MKGLRSTLRILLLCLVGVGPLWALAEEAPGAATGEAVEAAVKEAAGEEETSQETDATADSAETTPAETPVEPENPDDELANEQSEVEAAVALRVSADPVQVYGWREWVVISDGKTEEKLKAKLDSGALTSSIHVEEKELFERDGKKWVRFVVSDPRDEDAKRLRIEAPLVRIARIKETGGTSADSEAREVVRLPFRIGDRRMQADFTLNNRENMLNPVLLGRRALKQLGWVDASRAYLADKKVMR